MPDSLQPQSPASMPLSPALTSPMSHTTSPIDDRHVDRHPQSHTRAHAQRPSDASSVVDTSGNVRIRTWDEEDEEDVHVHVDGPETPKTPKTSPSHQTSSPSVASQASLTPPTFAPNTRHIRKPSLTLATQSLAAASQQSQQHLSSPISLRKQSSRLMSPTTNASMTSLLASPHSPTSYSSPTHASHMASTHSLASLSTPAQASGSNVLLPPVSIPTHKPSLTSLDSPKHKTSFTSLTSPTHQSSRSSFTSAANANNILSPLSGGQLSPVREKMTPSRKKSHSFLRRIGSKSVLGPVFNKESDAEGSMNWNSEYMRRDSSGGVSALPRSSPSLISLRSPKSLLSLRRGHMHTTSDMSSATGTSVGLLSSQAISTSSSFDNLNDSGDPTIPDAADSPSAPPPPRVPPKPMHITSNHPMYAPFNLAFGTAQPYFEWLERPDNVLRFKRFGKAMTGTSKWEVPGAILDGTYPYYKFLSAVN